MTQLTDEYKGRKLTELFTEALGELRNNQDRIIGKVIEFKGSDYVNVMTNIDRRRINGEIPRGRFLVMFKTGPYWEEDRLHFIVLQRKEQGESPVTEQEKLMLWTSEVRNEPINNDETLEQLNYSIFKCKVVGTYYLDDDSKRIEFSDMPPDTDTCINYSVSVPDVKTLYLIVNSQIIQRRKDINTGEEEKQDPIYFPVGLLRESQPGSMKRGYVSPKVPVLARVTDYLKQRSVFCGKSRMGKSNLAKTHLLNLHPYTAQLVFEKGEYSNSNWQDGIKCIADMIPGCVVYGLTFREDYPDRKLVTPDFYQNPSIGRRRLMSLLRNDNADKTDYVGAAFAVDIPSIENVKELWEQGPKEKAESTRGKRKIKIYWGILKKARFDVNEYELEHLNCGSGGTGSAARGKFCLGLKKDLLMKIYNPEEKDPKKVDPAMWPRQDSLDDMLLELKKVYTQLKDDPELFASDNGEEDSDKNDRGTFDQDDLTLFRLLFPSGRSSGPEKLKKYNKYHEMGGGNGSGNIIKDLDAGKTVFVNLGEDEDEDLIIMTTKEITEDLHAHRKRLHKIARSKPGNEPRSVIVYYEEAQDLFPRRGLHDPETVYVKLAKQGTKLGVGLVCITQDLTAIEEGIFSQTDNWIAVHMSSEKEVNTICSFEGAFKDQML